MLIYLHILTQNHVIIQLQDGRVIAKILQIINKYFLNGFISIICVDITHAWKACIRQKRIGGSNPPLSANLLKFNYLSLFS